MGTLYEDIFRYARDDQFRSNIQEKVSHYNQMMPLIRYIYWLFNINDVARSWHIMKAADSAISKATRRYDDYKYEPFVDHVCELYHGKFHSGFKKESENRSCVNWFFDMCSFRSYRPSNRFIDGEHRMKSRAEIARHRVGQLWSIINETGPKDRIYTDKDALDLKLIGIDKLPCNVTKNEIHAATRRALLNSHPDKGGTNEDFIKVTEAITRLKNNGQSLRNSHVDQLFVSVSYGLTEIALYHGPGSVSSEEWDNYWNITETYKPMRNALDHRAQNRSTHTDTAPMRSR